jgi:hypothetical protein
VSAHSSTHSRFLLEIMRTKPLNNAAFSQKRCESSCFAASPLLKERSTQVAGMPMTPLRQMEAGNSTHHLISFHFGNVPSRHRHSGVETRSFVERCQEQPLDQPCVKPCTGPPCPLVCQTHSAQTTRQLPALATTPDAGVHLDFQRSFSFLLTTCCLLPLLSALTQCLSRWCVKTNGKAQLGPGCELVGMRSMMRCQGSSCRQGEEDQNQETTLGNLIDFLRMGLTFRLMWHARLDR